MRAIPIVLFLAAACGDPAGPGRETPGVLAVNGAALPLLRPGDTVAIEGRGFGPAQAQGTVRLGDAPLEVLAWSATGITAIVTPAVAGDLLVTNAEGLALAPVTVRERAADTVGTDARAWTAAADLPFPLAQAGAAGITIPTDQGFTAFIVLFGGRRADGTLTDSTRIGRTDGGSGIAAWASAPDTVVPDPRRLHAMVGASRLTSRVREGGVAWMLGGVDSTGRVLADVFGMAVSDAGAYGFWTPLTPLPGERAGLAAAVGYGVVYVAGGFGADGLARRDVHVAAINPEGTLAGWFRGPDLPVGLAFAAAAVAGDRLYVAGGVTGAAHPDSTDPAALAGAVFSIRVSRRTGFFADSTWTSETATLLAPRARHALVAAAGGLVVVGGVTADTTAADTEAAPIASGGLGAFLPRTAAARPGGPRFDFGAPVFLDGTGRPVVAVVGGRTATGPVTGVWWH